MIRKQRAKKGLPCHAHATESSELIKTHQFFWKLFFVKVFFYINIWEQPYAHLVCNEESDSFPNKSGDKIDCS